MKTLVISLCLLLLAACSSIKPPIEPQAKLDADTYYNQGLKWEAMKRYDDAYTGYYNSLQAYRSIANAQGMASSMCSMARTALVSGELDTFIPCRKDADSYIKEVEPSLGYLIVQLDVFKAQHEKDYTLVSELARYEASYPLDVKLQLASAKLQADTHLGKGSAALASDLEKLASQYRKQLKKKAGNAELYSLALYSLAFYQYGQKNYDKTLAYLAKSNKIDYEYGNLKALGHGLMLKGQAEMASGKPEDALSSLRRAETIFWELIESDAINTSKDGTPPTAEELMPLLFESDIMRKIGYLIREIKGKP
ncbi:MAG: hypothetical protein KA984_02490 [Candidatus Cloacimonetes bacterium]|nr:hypothetical protein [Candidatus Cloacimonadota bacterium]